MLFYNLNWGVQWRFIWITLNFLSLRGVFTFLIFLCWLILRSGRFRFSWFAGVIRSWFCAWRLGFNFSGVTEFWMWRWIIPLATWPIIFIYFVSLRGFLSHSSLLAWDLSFINDFSVAFWFLSRFLMALNFSILGSIYV